MPRFIAPLLLIGLNVGVLNAQEEGDKRKYHLFNRTPKSEMRAMHTDRPDVTETPFTVDAGHLQFELDLLNFRQHPGRTQRQERDIYLINGLAKVGLTDRIDFEVEFSVYQWHFSRLEVGERPIIDRRGMGDLGLRAKINLIGNDTEDFGLALMPAITLPMRNSATENSIVPGGAIIWAKALPADFEIGGQLESYVLIDRTTTERLGEHWFTFEVGKDFGERWGTFVEYVGIFSLASTAISTCNAGVIRMINENFHIDCAFHYGLTEAAHSSVYIGFSLRI